MVVGLFLQSGKAPPEPQPDSAPEPQIPLYSLWQPMGPQPAHVSQSAPTPAEPDDSESSGDEC